MTIPAIDAATQALIETGPPAAAPSDASLELAPGRKLLLRCDDWAGGRYLAFPLRHEGTHNAMLAVHFFARGEAEARWSCRMSYYPGLACLAVIDLAWLDGQAVFPKRYPGRLKCTTHGRRLPVADIDRLELELVPSDWPQSIRLGPVRLTGDEPDTAAALPDGVKLLDPIGQRAGHDWPGRTRDVEELCWYLRNELAALESIPTNRRPPFPDRSRFGGFTSLPRQPSAGFFRTHHDGRRWWLIDPEGYLFFSIGVDCVEPRGQAALLPGTEKLCAWVPDPAREPEFAPALIPGIPGRGLWGLPSVDYAIANLIRAFGGADRRWFEAWSRITRHRLSRWGFNTVANWSSLEFARSSGTPYVLTMPSYPSTAVKLFRDLPDVFDPVFASESERFARWLEPFADDPMVIGYFLSNEPQWGFGRFNLAAEMLEANPGTFTRRALCEFVRERYGNDASAWSAAWGRPMGAFDRLVTDLLPRIADASRSAFDDLWEFSRRIVRRFIELPARACRRVDPHHLNLGLRYAWIASELFYEAGECFDVFSINCYREAPIPAEIEEISRRSGKPVMIGEFHFGALDRGLTGNGLRAVTDQSERGAAYRYFVEQAAAQPALIGTHYFQLYDQNYLGRPDGENWNIGLLDVCHRPHEPMLVGVIDTHRGLAEVVGGSRPPTERRGRSAVRVAN